MFWQGITIWTFAFLAMVFGPFELLVPFLVLQILGITMVWKDSPSTDEILQHPNGLVKKDFILNKVMSDIAKPINCSVTMGQSICFFAEGYGDHYSQDGHGCPVMIENEDGILKLYVWDDINSEDPRIISLVNARESQRK